MTFLVAFHRPDYALVAADTRGYLLEDGPDAPLERPRGITDGVRKVYALPEGWLVGAFHAASLDRIAAALSTCALTDTASVSARLAALRPTVHQWLSSLPSRRAAQARDAAHVWTIAPGPTGFLCRDFNWVTGDEDVVATGEVGACVPAGMAEGDLVALLHPFHAALGVADLWDALRRTAALFRAVADHLGPAGSVSADVEIGALWRDGAGRVVRGHVPPTAAARLKAATAEDLEGLLLAPETRCHVPQRLPQTAELYALNTKTVKVGTVASPSSITKTLRIPYGEFLPRSNAELWFLEPGYFRPNAANTLLLLQAPLVFPVGVTITKFRIRHYRQTTSDIASAALDKVSDSGFTSIASFAHASTGWVTDEYTLSQLVGAEGYMIVQSLKGVAAAADARLQFAEIDYLMPDYSKGY